MTRTKNDLPYYIINREERNHVAILYHLLLSGTDNLKRFLALLGQPLSSPIVEYELYYEYALLRDWWKQLGVEDQDATERKRTWILDKLRVPTEHALRSVSIPMFNSTFAPRGGTSLDAIQSPANWVTKAIHELEPELHRRAHLLKWCFNLKPDLVIVSPNGSIISIEAKMESGEDRYTAEVPGEEPLVIGQRDCQRMMFTEMLDVDAEKLQMFLLVRRKSAKRSGEQITWSEVFNALDLSTSHSFVQRWVTTNTILTTKRP